MSRWEAAHVAANLSDDDLSSGLIHARDRIQQSHCFLERAAVVLDFIVEAGDRLFEARYLAQKLCNQESVTRLDPACKGFRQFFPLPAQLAPAQARHRSGSGLSFYDGSQHRSSRYTHDVHDDARKLDTLSAAPLCGRKADPLAERHASVGTVESEITTRTCRVTRTKCILLPEHQRRTFSRSPANTRAGPCRQWEASSEHRESR